MNNNCYSTEFTYDLRRQSVHLSQPPSMDFGVAVVVTKCLAF